MARIVSSALEALLAGAVDYAGLFPPASLPLEVALANYRSYQAGEFGWMLGRFIAPEQSLPQVPPDFDGSLSILTNRDCPRASSIESKIVCSTGKPTYCEVSIGELDSVAARGSYAKIRTGGVTPEAIPSAMSIAEYIHECAERRLALKVTAGLHHPIRSVQALTYESGAPRSLLHGFINVLLAAAFAWHENKLAILHEILDETDRCAFRFDEAACWRDLSLDKSQITEARRHFIHSFGSCSFEEPVDDLLGLGWL